MRAQVAEVASNDLGNTVNGNEIRRRAVWRVAALLAGMALVVLLFWKLPVRQWLESFLFWVRTQGAWGTLIYGILYALGAVLMVPGSALTAGAGLLYGTLIGVLIVSPASVLGATLSFLIARYFARNWVERKLQAYPRFAAIDAAVERQGFKIILLVRLQPVLPFVLLNYALGLTRVRLADYIVASWIGMLPATIVYVYLGSALHSISELFSGGTLKHNLVWVVLFWGGLAAGVLLLWIFTRVARQALQHELNDFQAKGSGA